jgi:hypothetical protein
MRVACLARERPKFEHASRPVSLRDTARSLSRQLLDLPTLRLNAKQRAFLAQTERNLSELSDFLNRAAGTAPAAPLALATKLARSLRDSFAQFFAESSNSTLTFETRALLSVVFVYLLDFPALTSPSRSGSSSAAGKSGKESRPRGPKNEESPKSAHVARARR